MRPAISARLADREGLASPKSEDEMEGRASLERVVRSRLVVDPASPERCLSVCVYVARWRESVEEQSIHLLSTEDQALLNGRDALLLLDLLLDLSDLSTGPCQRCDERAETARPQGLQKRGGDFVPCSRARCRARSPCRSVCAPWKRRVRQFP